MVKATHKRASCRHVRVSRQVAQVDESSNGVDESNSESDTWEAPMAPFLRYEFPVDLWGMTMLVLVTDVTDIIKCRGAQLQYIRFGFTVFCAALNLALQVGILLFINTFVVEASVQVIQQDYKAFHEQTFSAQGHFNSTAWQVFAGKKNLCEAALLSKPFFATTIVFLWLSQVLGEFREVDRYHRFMQILPSLPSHLQSASMVQGDFLEDDEELLVVCLTRHVCMLTYLLVIIPKAGIAVVLCHLGCRWLSAATSFEDLILNALALAFVTDIDNIILSNFLPAYCTKTLQRYKFALNSGVDKCDHRAKLEQEIISVFKRSIMFVAMVMTTVLFYMTVLQDIIPGYKFDVQGRCSADFADSTTPTCGWNDQSCFPYGPSESVAATRQLLKCVGDSLNNCIDRCPIEAEVFAACYRSCKRRCESGT